MRVGFLVGGHRILQLCGFSRNPAHIHCPVVAFRLQLQRIFQDLSEAIIGGEVMSNRVLPALIIPLEEREEDADLMLDLYLDT